MDFLSFAKMIHDDVTSMKFIESRCSKNVTCKFCNGKQIYIMKSRNQLRCKICKKDFKPFANSNFSVLKMSYSKWLALIKLFELSVSAKTASEQMQLSYKTTLKAFDATRFSILEEQSKTDDVLKGQIEAYFGGKRKGKSQTWCQKQDNCIWHTRKKQRCMLRL